MNDLSENAEYLDSLTSIGLYADYGKLQYSTGIEIVDRIRSLSTTDLTIRLLSFDASYGLEPKIEPTNEPFSWLLPALVGFGVGVLVCLVPTAIVLIVRRRKKKAGSEPPAAEKTAPSASGGKDAKKNPEPPGD